MKELKELTRAEDQVMQILWKLERAFVKDIIARLPKPKPACNTVSTFVRTLEPKGFFGHQPMGKSHKYHPLITKEAYTRAFMKGFVKRYFSGSYQQMVSFFTRQDKLSLNELEELVFRLKKIKDGKS